MWHFLLKMFLQSCLEAQIKMHQLNRAAITIYGALSRIVFGNNFFRSLCIQYIMLLSVRSENSLYMFCRKKNSGSRFASSSLEVSARLPALHQKDPILVLSTTMAFFLTCVYMLSRRIRSAKLLKNENSNPSYKPKTRNN